MMLDSDFATCADKKRVMKLPYHVTEKPVEKGEQGVSFLTQHSAEALGWGGGGTLLDSCFILLLRGWRFVHPQQKGRRARDRRGEPIGRRFPGWEWPRVLSANGYFLLILLIIIIITVISHRVVFSEKYSRVPQCSCGWDLWCFNGLVVAQSNWRRVHSLVVVLSNQSRGLMLWMLNGPHSMVQVSCHSSALSEMVFFTFGTFFHHLLIQDPFQDC